MMGPGSTIGILGGGQLGRMMILAGRPLGYSFHVYEPGSGSCAGAIADKHYCAAYTDQEAIETFCAGVDVVTLEFENIPLEVLAALEGRVPLRPGKRVLEVCRHRLREKRFLQENGFPHVPFREVNRAEDLKAAIEELGLPVVVKTAVFGYDGKGQTRVDSLDGFSGEAIWEGMGNPDAVVVEKWIPFNCEVSAVCARSVTGESTVFPIAENIHRNHILHQSLVPARIEDAVAMRAEELACRLADALEVVGLLAVEYFITESGEVLINEMAPRPHNSGHYSLDACEYSQFEQHLRVVTGGNGIDPGWHTPVVMTNLLGDLWKEGKPPEWERVFDIPGAHLHLYDKGEPRPGRKMGHINMTGDDLEDAIEQSNALWKSLGGDS